MLKVGTDVTLKFSDNLDSEPHRIRHFKELAEYRLPLRASIEIQEQSGEKKKISSEAYVKKVAKTKDGKIVIAVTFENEYFRKNIRKSMNIEFDYSDARSGFRFVSQFLGWSYDDLGVVLLPQKVEVKRREMYRVKPHPNYPIEVEVIYNGRKAKGWLLDINEKGIGIKFQNLPFQLKREDRLRLVFSLPQKSSAQAKETWEKIVGTGEVRGVREADNAKIVGIEFVELDNEMRDKIRTYWKMRQGEELSYLKG